MRYWFHSESDEAFALPVPPPDGQGVVEIDEATYNEIIAACTLVAASPAAPAPPPASPAMDMERLARIWRKMDDAMSKLKEECEAEVQKIKVQQDQLSAVLLGQMNLMKADKLATEAGVIERKEETHANAADWGAIWRFIAENNKFEMVQKRLTTGEVLKWAKAHATKDERGAEVLALPPGVNLFTKYKITVKKPGGKPLPKDDEGN